MDAYISHHSARAFWDTVEDIDAVSTRSGTVNISGAAATHQGLKTLGIPRSALVGKRLHVLVGSQSERRTSKYVSTHVYGCKIPRDAFRKISPHLFVSSPEFLFVQMALCLQFAELVELGCELCGTYIPKPSDPLRLSRKPLTDKRKIESFIDRARGVYGTVKARRALRYVVELSNSPMETALEMLLCLPCKRGGYGLPVPQMNYQIRLTKAESLELGRNVYICDLCWPDAGYALEYYGREWHSGTQSVAKDARRQSDLHYHGIDIDIVTYEQIETWDQVQLLAKKIARRFEAIFGHQPNNAWLSGGAFTGCLSGGTTS